MIYLFIHQNFPGQYRHIVKALAQSTDNTVYFITQPNVNYLANVTKIEYSPNQSGLRDSHPFVTEFDQAVRAGLGVAEVCRALRNDGITPDVIVGHNGWGETLFVKDVFPDVPLLVYFEFYYHGAGVDVGFDPEFSTIFFGDPGRLRVRNAVNLMGFAAADWGHTPTQWQRSLFPPEMQRRITVIHEGVDTDVVRPDPAAWVKLLGEDVLLTSGDEVITYVARSLEPYRGFHIFMRAAAKVLARRSKARVLVVGNDGVSYGMQPPPGTTYREYILDKIGNDVDRSRIHFLGQVEYEQYLKILQVSSVHVYLTYPFVLSWSFIEALAAGCLVIGSATPPVLEVLRNRENGLLVDFFAVDDLARLIEGVIARPRAVAPLRDRARETAVRLFDLKRRQLPRWHRLLEEMTEGRRNRLKMPDLPTTASTQKKTPPTMTAPRRARHARRKTDAP
jgi:glycosyltransferase involved in cell wall biosynthesis